MSTSLSNRVFRTVSTARRTPWLLALGAVLCAAAPPARAGTKVAVIDGGPLFPETHGQLWCEFLDANGYDCTLYPVTGPTESLSPFALIIDMSEKWEDAEHRLADALQVGKGVITWGFAPFALRVDKDTVVQSWIGANRFGSGTESCWVTSTDSILGDLPPGTEIANCGKFGCTGLDDT